MTDPENAPEPQGSTTPGVEYAFGLFATLLLFVGIVAFLVWVLFT